MATKKNRPIKYSNAAPRTPNDFSDIEHKFKRHHSNLIDRIRREGLYEDFIETIASISFTSTSKVPNIVSGLRERFPDQLGSLTEATFHAWIKYMPDVAKAVNFRKQFALGQLVYMAMQRARYTMYADRQEDFILKLMDRLDDGTISHKNAVKAALGMQEETGMSPESMMTLSRIFAEASRFGSLHDVNIDDMEEPEESSLLEDDEE